MFNYIVVVFYHFNETKFKAVLFWVLYFFFLLSLTCSFSLVFSFKEDLVFLLDSAPCFPSSADFEVFPFFMLVAGGTSLDLPFSVVSLHSVLRSEVVLVLADCAVFAQGGPFNGCLSFFSFWVWLLSLEDACLSSSEV